MPPCGVVTDGVVDPMGADPPWDPLPEWPDDPLQATQSTGTAATTAGTQKRLQARNDLVDSTVMEAAQFYRGAEPSPEALPRPTRAELEARVADLERVVASLAELHKERLVDRRAALPDPVALTRALHPRSLRRLRNTKRGSSSDGTIAMRAVLFRPPSPR